MIGVPIYFVLEVDGSIAFEGSPEDVEDWLFENRYSVNERLRVKMGDFGPILPAMQYIDAA